MTLPSADELLDVCERVLARIGADAEAEVTAAAGTNALTRFANSFIHQNVADDERRIRLRVALDGRVADAYANQTDDEALDRLVRSATEAAGLRPPDPGWPGLAPPAPAPSVDHWDQATAEADPASRASRVGTFVAAAGGLETAGYCSTAGMLTAFANTVGQRLTGRATSAALDGIARSGSSDGSGRAMSMRVGDLDGSAVGAEATHNATGAANPSDLEPGRYEVVLSPWCVGNILGFLTVYGLNGRAVEEGRSFADIGKVQFDPAVTLSDDVTHPRALGMPFDDEGTPKSRTELVSAGVTMGVLHDRRTAKALGTQSTGHAVAGSGEFGALASNLVLEAGAATRDELIGSIERGLVVNDFWYTRVLDPRTIVVTGLTRNGVWLVEDGRIVRPVSNLRFTQSYVDALGPGAVRGVGSELTLVGGLFGGGGWPVPWLHLGSWNFTGGAKG